MLPDKSVSVDSMRRKRVDHIPLWINLDWNRIFNLGLVHGLYLGLVFTTKGKGNHFGRGCEFALSVAATAMVPSPVTSSAVRKCTSAFTLVYPFFVRYITIRFQPSPTSFVNALGSNVLVTRDPWPVGWTVRLRMGFTGGQIHRGPKYRIEDWHIYSRTRGQESQLPVWPPTLLGLLINLNR